VRKGTEISRQQIIDELGEVERKFRLWKPAANPHAARLAELRATVTTWFQDKPPDASYVMEGSQYRLEVKPAQFRRDMTSAAQAAAFDAVKKMGVAPFSIFKATQESIAKILGEKWLDSIAPKKRTGPRTFSLVAKSAPSIKEKAAA